MPSLPQLPTPPPTTIRGIRAQLAALGVAPYKGWGQNFLTDASVTDEMVKLAGLGPGDAVVEIGPGLGVLTHALLACGARVTAVEIDARLATYLASRYGHLATFSLVQQDVLATPFDAVAPAGPYTVAANLPYSVTSAMLRHILTATHRPKRLVVMVQAEVAERIVARPPAMSLLAVSVQFYATATLAFTVPAESFSPQPEVDSAVLVLDGRQPPLPPADEAAFFSLVATGFRQRRKTLANSLATGRGVPRAQAEAWLSTAGIVPTRRAETLDVSEWVALYTAWQAAGHA